MRLFVEKNNVSENVSKVDVYKILSEYVFQDGRSEPRTKIRTIVEKRFQNQEQLFEKNSVSRLTPQDEISSEWKDLLELRDVIKDFISEVKTYKLQASIKRYFGKNKTEKYNAMEVEKINDEHTVQDIEDEGDIYSALTGADSPKFGKLKNKGYILNDKEKETILQDFLGEIKWKNIIKGGKTVEKIEFEGEGSQNKESIFSGLSIKRRGLTGEKETYSFSPLHKVSVDLEKKKSKKLFAADENELENIKETWHEIIREALNQNDDFEDKFYDAYNEYSYDIQFTIYLDSSIKDVTRDEGGIKYYLAVALDPNEEIIFTGKEKSGEMIVRRNIARIKYFDEIIGRVEVLEDFVDELPEE